MLELNGQSHHVRGQGGVGKVKSVLVWMKKGKDQGGALLFVSPSRKVEEEERIQNSNKGREEGGKPGSEDLRGESEWQEFRSESEVYYVAKK